MSTQDPNEPVQPELTPQEQMTAELEQHQATQEPEPPQVTAPAPVAAPDLTPEEIASIREFRDWARDHPQEIDAWGQVLAGQAQIVPMQAPPPVQEEERPDPLESVQLPPELADELRALRSQVQGVAKFAYDSAYERNNAALDAGMDEFRERYGLTPEEAEPLEAEVARLGILPVLAAQVGDPQRAFADALELVYYRTPQNRTRELERMRAQSTEAESRKRKAGVLAGGSAAASRAPEPAVANDRNALVGNIAADIRAAQRGQLE